jgi:hypothetical protein
MQGNDLLEVSADGASITPLTVDQARYAVQAGQLSPHAYARSRGSQQWITVGQILAQAAPPPPPPAYLQPTPQHPAYVAAPAPGGASAPAYGAPASQSPAHVVQQQMHEAEQRLAALRRELESVEEAIEIQSFGFYRPRYGFETAEHYNVKLREVRDQQKQMIKDKTATFCEAEWSVGGSRAEGIKMIGRIAKLMLRAFNGECDAAIAKTKYDNVLNLEERITKSCADINTLGRESRLFISEAYYKLKLAELHLVHEHREKQHQDKEEQKRLKEQMRDEVRAQEEIERVQAEVEEEEARYEKALAKARAELAASHAATAITSAKQTEKLEALVTRLENELRETLDRKVKAMARAQLTRSGHVYVLSNVGSFGEGIYKIGLTRRFEPLERVDELGDASVPFPFDVHAIIYSEDAPSLEAALHREFTSRRVNMVNARKEYFRVSLEEIRAAVEKHHGLVTFVLTPEAEEWRRTHAMLTAQQSTARDD